MAAYFLNWRFIRMKQPCVSYVWNICAKHVFGRTLLVACETLTIWGVRNTRVRGGAKHFIRRGAKQVPRIWNLKWVCFIRRFIRVSYVLWRVSYQRRLSWRLNEFPYECKALCWRGVRNTFPSGGAKHSAKEGCETRNCRGAKHVVRNTRKRGYETMAVFGQA